MRKTVLVCVLKSKDDLRLLLEKHWYRIPLSFLPKRAFTHIAFYEPLSVGAEGKRIEYYARVSRREVRKRIELLPDEREHPRAMDEYLKCSFKKIHTLAHPIRNVIPRRVSFGFTDLETLRSARDILELYHVAPTEQLIEAKLRRLGIPFTPQYRLTIGKRRFRVDIALLCRAGNVAIECDNRRAHSGTLQKQKDRDKNAVLYRAGWRVIRLAENDILLRLDVCISRIKQAVHSLGGIS